MTSPSLPKIALAETLAQNIAALDAARLPQAVGEKCEELLIDVIGLAITARNQDYVKSVLAACDDDGSFRSGAANWTGGSADAPP